MTMNVYRALLQLLPQDPLRVGNVTAVHSADGTVTVELPGGGTERVRGTAAVDDRVFIRSGAVDGPAPELAVLMIEE